MLKIKNIKNVNKFTFQKNKNLISVEKLKLKNQNLQSVVRK